MNITAPVQFVTAIPHQHQIICSHPLVPSHHRIPSQQGYPIQYPQPPQQVVNPAPLPRISQTISIPPPSQLVIQSTHGANHIQPQQLVPQTSLQLWAQIKTSPLQSPTPHPIHPNHLPLQSPPQQLSVPLRTESLAIASAVPTPPATPAREEKHLVEEDKPTTPVSGVAETSEPVPSPVDTDAPVKPPRKIYPSTFVPVYRDRTSKKKGGKVTTTSGKKRKAKNDYDDILSFPLTARGRERAERAEREKRELREQQEQNEAEE